MVLTCRSLATFTTNFARKLNFTMPYKLNDKEAAALSAVEKATKATIEAIALCGVADLTGDTIINRLNKAELHLLDVSRTIRGEG